MIKTHWPQQKKIWTCLPGAPNSLIGRAMSNYLSSPWLWVTLIFPTLLKANSHLSVSVSLCFCPYLSVSIFLCPSVSLSLSLCVSVCLLSPTPPHLPWGEWLYYLAAKARAKNYLIIATMTKASTSSLKLYMSGIFVTLMVSADWHQNLILETIAMILPFISL